MNIDRYGGLLVHESFDEHGLIEIVDKAGKRALHFGSEARQSTMSLAEPDKLLSHYLKAMMCWQLFKETPKNPLMIGLGGGLLAKYFFNTFPECVINVIEFRREVLKVARSHFGLPLDARIKVKIGDGVAYVKQQASQASTQHDLLIVDAFDHQGMVAGTISLPFFDECKTLLTDDGLLIINLWGTNKPLYAQIQWNLQQVFGEQVLYLPVRGRGNVIGFAFNHPAPDFSFKELKAKTWTLQEQYHLDFPIFIKDLKRDNPYNFHRIIKR